MLTERWPAKSLLPAPLGQKRSMPRRLLKQISPKASPYLGGDASIRPDVLDRPSGRPAPPILSESTHKNLRRANSFEEALCSASVLYHTLCSTTAFHFTDLGDILTSSSMICFFASSARRGLFSFVTTCSTKEARRFFALAAALGEALPMACFSRCKYA